MTRRPCLPDMRLPIIASLVLASTAAAQPQPLVSAAERGLPVEPSRIGFSVVDGGKISSLGITVRNHPGHVHVTMALGLTTRSRNVREVALPIEVSSQVSVLGMVLESRDGRDEAQMMSSEWALTQYEQIIGVRKDPALLQRTGRAALGLRVYPVSRDLSVTVTIELALPYGVPLVLAPGKTALRAVALDLTGTAERKPLAGRTLIAVGDAIDAEGEEISNLRLDSETSLLAAPGLPAVPRFSTPRLRPHEPTLPANVDLLGDRDVARAAGAHAEELGRCFAPGTSRRASLVLSVATSGTITAVRVDDLDDAPAGDCLAKRVASWTLRETHRARTLRYALDL